MEFLQYFNFVKEEDLKPKSEEELYNEILNNFKFLTTKDLERPRLEDIKNYLNLKEDDPILYKIYMEICKNLDDEEKEYYENVINELIEIKKQKQEQLLKEYEERKIKVEEIKQDILRNNN